METQTATTPVKPVEFSDVQSADVCRWCDTELHTDGRGFSVCPHCDRPCGFNPCRECLTAGEKLSEFTEAEKETAALPPPDGHYWWPRRFWYALRTWLPPWPIPSRYVDEVDCDEDDAGDEYA